VSGASPVSYAEILIPGYTTFGVVRIDEKWALKTLPVNFELARIKSACPKARLIHKEARVRVEERIGRTSGSLLQPVHREPINPLQKPRLRLPWPSFHICSICEELVRKVAVKKYPGMPKHAEERNAGRELVHEVDVVFWSARP